MLYFLLTLHLLLFEIHYDGVWRHKYFTVKIMSHKFQCNLSCHVTISSERSTHAPPTMRANVNLTPPTVFSHPHHPRLFLLHPESSLGLLFCHALPLVQCMYISVTLSHSMPTCVCIFVRSYDFSGYRS